MKVEKLYISMASRQRSSGAHMWLNNLASLSFAERGNTYHGEWGNISVMRCEKGLTVFELVLEDYDFGRGALLWIE